MYLMFNYFLFRKWGWKCHPPIFWKGYVNNRFEYKFDISGMNGEDTTK